MTDELQPITTPSEQPPIDAELANPFQAGSTVNLPAPATPPEHHYNSIFVKILTTFFLLSATPITLSAILTAATYQSSIQQFLPDSSIQQVEQVLLAQNILILLLVVIMVIFAGSLITSSLIRPLRRLLELTHFVGAGKLSYKLRVTVHDEIGEQIGRASCRERV